MPVPTVVFRVHALQRMFERAITDLDVREVLAKGETVEEYPQAKPFPSRLILGWVGSRPVHVVAARDAQRNQVIVITAYEPEPERWLPDWKTRRRT